SLGIPYYTHESDLSPGLATRLNARRAEGIVISYEETRGRLPPALRAKARLAGNPIRRAIRRGDRDTGRAWLGVGDGLPVVLFLGGSQGARQLNELVEAILPALGGRAFVAHQAGPGSEPISEPGYRRFGFISREMPEVLAAADIVVGRSGAGTLWECGALGKPMILIPLQGSGTRGDQVENAELFAKAGAAISLSGKGLGPEALLGEIGGLLDDRNRASALGAAASRLAGTDAGDLVADLILGRIGARK
ncbi:MAG TPA: glycosyltransferase, partial [Rectinemataceae bacterium]|nr:glycosyltransferase [Rectinemataceae bacterium]